MMRQGYRSSWAVFNTSRDLQVAALAARLAAAEAKAFGLAAEAEAKRLQAKARRLKAKLSDAMLRERETCSEVPSFQHCSAVTISVPLTGFTLHVKNVLLS